MEGERLLAHEREENNSKVKGGARALTTLKALIGVPQARGEWCREGRAKKKAAQQPQ